MESILIAVDGSTGSDRAVEEGLGLAAATGAAVTFVFVRQPPMPILGSPYYQRSRDQRARARRGGARARARPPPRDYGVAGVRRHLRGLRLPR